LPELTAEARRAIVVRELPRWGREACLRAALALARARVAFDWTSLETGDTRVEKALDTLDNWLADATAISTEALRAAADGAYECVGVVMRLMPSDEEFERAGIPDEYEDEELIPRESLQPLQDDPNERAPTAPGEPLRVHESEPEAVCWR